MRSHKNCSTRSLINTTGFHSDNTVFNDIDDSDSMFSTETVQLCDDFRNFHLFSVYALRNTCFKCHCNVFIFIRSFLWCCAQHEKIIVVWLICRILKFKSFMADVPQVTVTAVAVLCVKWKINSMSFTVINLVFTGLHCPYICHTPWSDDLDVRSKSFDTKLETDLVISFSCCTMADSNSAFFTCNLNQFLSDCRTSHGSSEKVFVLVNSSGFYTRNNEVITEFIDDIFNI